MPDLFKHTSQPGPKTPRLHALLGTKDERQQVQIVNALAQPTVIVTIALRPFDGYVHVAAADDHGNPVAPATLYAMLDRARLVVAEQERRQMMQASVPPPPSQPPPSQPPAAPPTPAPTPANPLVADAGLSPDSLAPERRNGHHPADEHERGSSGD